MLLSVVIPAYNEEFRIKPTLERIFAYLSGKDFEYEVIIVDDGSVDKTEKTVLDSLIFKSGKARFLKNDQNKGKGYSVKRGILASKGDYVLFSDADLSTPIEEFDKLFSCLKSGYDIAVGSRNIEGSDVQIHQPFYRELMGKLFNKLVKLLVLKGIVDTQCGFKLFKGEVIKKIAAQLKVDGFAFDVEMLYLAIKNGFSIIEVPVIWVNSPLSRVSFLTDGSKMLNDLFLIKRLHPESKI